MAKNITIIALTVALSCCPLFQQKTAAAVKLCDESNTWVYLVSGRMFVPQTQKYHTGSIVHHMRFKKDNSNPDSKYMIFHATRTLMLDDSDGRSFDICVSSSDNQAKWLFKEEGSKVWVYDNDRQRDVLMYDFSAKTEDILPGRQKYIIFPEEQDFRCAVLELPDTLLGGKMRHRYTATITYDSNTTIANPELECIEGIGVTCGFLPEMYVMQITHGPYEEVAVDRPGMLGYLVAVYDNNGDFIYGDEESYSTLLNRVSGISVIMDSDDDAAPTYFNLQGQRISAPVKGQICIERHGGKTRKIIM